MIYTHQVAGEEDTTRIWVFKVKSKGTFWPGKQKLPDLANEWSAHLSEELEGKPTVLEDSWAASPFNALSYGNKLQTSFTMDSLFKYSQRK